MSTPDPDLAGSSVERQRNAERKTVSGKVTVIAIASAVILVALGVALGLHFSSSTDQDGSFHRSSKDKD